MRKLILLTLVLAGCAIANTDVFGPTLEPILTEDVQIVNIESELPSDDCVAVAIISTKELIVKSEGAASAETQD